MDVEAGAGAPKGDGFAGGAAGAAEAVRKSKLGIKNTLKLTTTAKRETRALLRRSASAE